MEQKNKNEWVEKIITKPSPLCSIANQSYQVFCSCRTQKISFLVWAIGWFDKNKKITISTSIEVTSAVSVFSHIFFDVCAFCGNLFGERNK
jgi:hypothetical protein